MPAVVLSFVAGIINTVPVEKKPMLAQAKLEDPHLHGGCICKWGEGGRVDK